MNYAVLVRERTCDEGTFGRLHLLGSGWSCYTAELPWRNNERNISCIPSGWYKMTFLERSASGRFRNVFLIEDVPGRSGILIHTGNYAGDVSKGIHADVNGCILVGRRTGTLNGQQVVLASRLAHQELRHQLGKEPTVLWILDRSQGQLR